jgi:anti-sigma factor (TIGR02949 family)
VKCAEATSSVQAYVDGELTGVDREQMQRHIGTCETCARSSLLQGRFKAAVRVHLPRPPVPSDFRRRLRASLDAVAPEPPLHRWAWLRYSRLVPAVGAAVAIMLITLTVQRTQSQVLGQAQRTYQAEMPMDVVGSDCGSIASWFRGRVDFPVHAPAFANHSNCKGGRLVNVGEHLGAYLVLQDGSGHRVALLVYNPGDESLEAPHRRVINGREIYLGGGPGISTAAYRDRGLGYVVTSDLDEDALTRMVTASFRVSSP